MNAALDRLGRWCAHRHWAVLAVWVLVLAAVVLASRAWAGEFANDYSVPGSESAEGLAVLEEQFPQAGGYAGQIVFAASGDGAVADQQAAVSGAMTAVGALPDVLTATDPFAVPSSPLVSADGTVAYGPVSWSVVPGSLDEAYLDQLDDAVAPARAAGLEVEYGGGAGKIGHVTDDRDSEAIGLGIALVLLLVMFGSVVAALLPLVSAVASVLAGLSLVGLLAALWTFPDTAPTVATLLGLGVAVDYGLFLVARHRDQLDHGADVVTSAGRANATSGAAIVIAGSTVVVAILGLYVAGVPFVGAMGLAAAVVVAVAMLAALTLVPALLGLAGPRVLARRDRRARQAAVAADDDPATTAARLADLAARSDEAHERSAFARWGRRVSDRPLPWALLSTAVLVVLAIPVLSLQLGQVDAGTDPTTETDRRAYDLLAEGFGPGINGPLSVVVVVPDGTSPDDATTLLTNTATTLGQTPGVASVGAPNVDQAGDTAVLTVVPTTSPQDQATTELVQRLRSDVLPGVPADTFVVGTTAGYVDFTDKIAARMPWLILTVVALSFVLLTVAFRSVVIATKAAVLNLLSVGAAYGVVVAVFQWGWGSSWIGIEEDLPIPAFVPMLMFAIVFGLSMDYEVFLLSRVHEAWSATRDAHRSVAIGIGGTARVITTAAAVMVVVFSSFVLDPDPTVKMLAVGMAAAVLIDASVIRMVLVPAVMSLLGARAWWMPRWLERVVPDVDIEGSAHLARVADLVPAPRAGEEAVTPAEQRGPAG
ncbi:MMPL domain transmembrane transporter [Modestobacter italicus]|uniref:MMPL domain transmembrane transporter n=1 Tax=Modestobacter italicus (strain DSM 44449 / CECT 9708 / BC 501) TaxID=2732864 RepID=I4ETJ2_MODI5|nr:MMPL family transporter [Modestobacter marinus]CCH86705.1 MMPL domain transmembrane transporter [Modestobacter marinus]